MNHRIGRKSFLTAAAAAFSIARSTSRPAAAISCADIVSIDGVLYQSSTVNNQPIFGRRLIPADLGPLHRRIAANVATRSAGRSLALPSPAIDCAPGPDFATSLPVGTALYTVNGYAPAFRLAVAWPNGRIELFEATENPAARVGADRFDIAKKVRGLEIRDTAGALMATIDDPQTVRRLETLLVSASVNPDQTTPRRGLLTLVWRLTDGTVTTDRWQPRRQLLASTVAPPPEFHALLSGALATPRTAPVSGTPASAAPI